MSTVAVRLAEPHAPHRPSSVLIVDDSAVARAALEQIIESDAHLSVAAAVSGALPAIDWLKRNRVDVVLLDLEMPGMNGLAALPELLAAGRGAQVLIVSSTAREGAEATLRALALGAADTLAKPSAGQLHQRFGDVLIDRVRRLAKASAAASVNDRFVLRRESRTPVGLLAIGASTGGLPALSDLLKGLSPMFTAPILITQHLPPAFMPYFADQIAAMSGRPARVADEGEAVVAGRIVVAPGTAHLGLERVDGRLTVRLSSEASVSRCCPSVDPMLSALARVAGTGAVAVVLTGMGRDGALGADDVVAAGGSVLVQDQASSAVWGMPGTVARAGLASVVGTPRDIARHLMRRGSA